MTEPRTFVVVDPESHAEALRSAAPGDRVVDARGATGAPRFPMTMEEARRHWRYAPWGCEVVGDAVMSLPRPHQKRFLQHVLDGLREDFGIDLPHLGESRGSP